RPLLLDFNLAHSARAKAGGRGGTPPYMAPEMIRACLDRQDLTTQQATRADLFSLGVIGYELLTGAHPFPAPPRGAPLEKVAEWLLPLYQAGPRPADELNPAVPRPLAQLLGRCLAVDPMARPESAQELVESLRRWQGRLARRRSRVLE